MRRCFATAVLVGLTAVGVQGVAGAQPYPPLSATVEVDPSAISCGADVTVTGAGWLGGSQVTITLTSDPVVLGSATVAADGTFQSTFGTPTPLDVAQHSLTASGTASNGTPATAPTTLTVTSCGAAGAGGALAFTGSDNTFGLLEIAIILLVIGAVLIVAMARRRKASLAA